MDVSDDEQRRRRAKVLVTAYPLVLLLVSALINWFLLGVSAVVIALPAIEAINALVIAAVLLVVNHTWLMTSTELTRVRYAMHATPEEWAASGTSPRDASKVGVEALERHHNAHRNTTENTIYFVFLAAIFVLVSPLILAAQVWIIGFAVARTVYTYSYIARNIGLRGLFMSLSLLCMYGMASYLAISLAL